MEWWHANWGNTASVIGVLVSLLTLVQAAGAKKAARSALAALKKQNLVEELASCIHRINSLEDRCNASDWIHARSESREIAQKITISINRWSEYLVGRASRDSLNLVVMHLGMVESQAGKLAARLPVHEDLVLIDRSLSEIRRRLSEEVGKHQRQAEA